MDPQFQHIRSRDELPAQAVRQLVDSGFVVIPGPYSGNRLLDMTTAYDEMMALASGSDISIASTTIRWSDVLNSGPAFDDVFLHPPLLEACAHIIGEPFKLSSLIARTVRPGAPAQDLHADLTRFSEDAPLVGFILMIDSFREDNGATRFVPSSHNWPDVPSHRMRNLRENHPEEILGCGDSGSMIIFNGAIWHGHTANDTSEPRRSMQGHFVRRNARSGTDFLHCLLPLTQARMSPSARYLLELG